MNHKPIDMKDLLEKLEKINETTSEQYEVMLDKAGELGEQIAGNVILDKQMNPDITYTEGRLEEAIEKHIDAAHQHISHSAHKYLQQHLKGGPRG